MKSVFFSFALTLIGSFSFQNCFAQSEKYEYTPKLFQSSLRIGLFNMSLNGEYRLNPKIMLSVDLGVGALNLRSNYCNKYNYNYAEYNEKTNNSYYLDLGGATWISPYSSLQVKYILDSRSKTKYSKSPYANTFSYLGLQFKGNAPSILNEDQNVKNNYRESYEALFIIGRQKEFTKDARSLLDIYFAVGLIANYKVEYFEPAIKMGVRLGLNLFERL
ncbi:MAG TPA: hypothetical protein VLZ83_14250 [Edaphocola sp.]|nr:hypothetical protein [Edaphocola sp.]